MKSNAGSVVLSLLALLASCGKAEPPPDEPPPVEPAPDASPPPDAPPSPDAQPAEPCGNGALDPGEACDTGGASVTCDVDCTAPVCGDSIINPAAGEQCDDGNAVAGDGCSECRRDCGNGRLDPGEACDAGDADGDGVADPTAACDTDCTAPACGDGSFNPAADETCDDGNDASADGCSARCVSEIAVAGLDFVDFDVRVSAVWRFDGTGWQKTQLWSSVQWLEDYWAAGPGDDYVVGSISDGGGEPVLRCCEALYHHTGGASEYIELPGPLGEGLISLDRIWGTPTTPVTLYVISGGDYGHDLLRYDAAGWALVELPGSPGIRDVWGTGPGDVYALAWNGTNFHFDGTSWTAGTLPPGGWDIVTGTGPSDVFLVDRYFGARFDGAQWTPWTTGRESFLIRALSSGGDGRFAVIDRAEVGVFDHGAWQFFDFTGQVEFRDVVMLPNGHVFAVGGTQIFHYDGQGWDVQAVNPPPFPDELAYYGPLERIQFTPGPP